MRVIIGICGRKESGKSVISDVCHKYGYEVTRFAEPLKQLISKLIDVERKDLDSLKTVEKEYTFGNEKLEFLSKETDIPIEFVNEKMRGKTFHNVRELLQVIGTDLIRSYNSDWHVNKIKEILTSEENKYENFIVDDVRFPNERALIEELGGSCWFIVRPRVDNISNHPSETSLKWQEFRNIIINDRSEEYLRFMWEAFMDRGYQTSLQMRDSVMEKLLLNKSFYLKNFDNDDSFCYFNSLMISKKELEYDDRFKGGFDGEILSAANGKVTIRNNEGEEIDVTNPLEIEDLKFFLC